jgi:hypothetical protein
MGQVEIGLRKSPTLDPTIKCFSDLGSILLLLIRNLKGFELRVTNSPVFVPKPLSVFIFIEIGLNIGAIKCKGHDKGVFSRVALREKNPPYPAPSSPELMGGRDLGGASMQP